MKKLVILLIIYVIFNISCESQEYNRVYYQDTTYIKFEIVENFELGKDSLYYIKYPYAIEGNWKVYYDIKMKHLLLESDFINDTCTMKQYYLNGNKNRILIISRKGHLIKDVSWYPSGQLMCEIDYMKEVIPIVKYYPNGNKRVEYINDGGYIIGNYKEWYNNKVLKTIGKFNNSNNKHGIWKLYKETGELEKIEEYDNGELIKEE